MAILFFVVVGHCTIVEDEVNMKINSRYPNKHFFLNSKMVSRYVKFEVLAYVKRYRLLAYIKRTYKELFAFYY